MSERVLVAMSGGVDSSVAAARLCRDGYDVVGVTLHLWDYPDDGSVSGRCCAPEDVHDARRVADALGIAHYAFDRRELFEREIVRPFVDAYLAGETPSPCVRCNRGVKMRELVALADRLGARWIATGHYARIGAQDGHRRILRARDAGKDQSYFLHMLPSDVVGRLLFPLGDAAKSEVRAEALSLGLCGASKGESQELCFVPTGRYDAFVAERAQGRVRPGPIVDQSGRMVGEHEGIHRFTIGQRKNLGISLGERAYVVGIDARDGVVRLGQRDELACRSARLEETSLAEGVTVPLLCEVAVRYRGKALPARVQRNVDATLTVHFDAPVHAVVPGQFAVFYAGDAVLGGGKIVSTEAAGAVEKAMVASP
jgi:tRNA-specific 2-thiouridylase